MLKARRHALLKECKVDDINLPFKRGSLKDVVTDDTLHDASQSEMDTAASSQVGALFLILF
jgi:hypothetical protein